MTRDIEVSEFVDSGLSEVKISVNKDCVVFGYRSVPEDKVTFMRSQWPEIMRVVEQLQIDHAKVRYE